MNEDIKTIIQEVNTSLANNPQYSLRVYDISASKYIDRTINNLSLQHLYGGFENYLVAKQKTGTVGLTINLRKPNGTTWVDIKTYDILFPQNSQQPNVPNEETAPTPLNGGLDIASIVTAAVTSAFAQMKPKETTPVETTTPGLSGAHGLSGPEIVEIMTKNKSHDLFDTERKDLKDEIFFLKNKLQMAENQLEFERMKVPMAQKEIERDKELALKELEREKEDFKRKCEDEYNKMDLVLKQAPGLVGMLTGKSMPSQEQEGLGYAASADKQELINLILTDEVSDIMASQLSQVIITELSKNQS